MVTMTVLLSSLAVIAMYLFWRRRRNQGIQTKIIAVEDIGELFRQISDQGVETSFAVLVIQSGEKDENENVEIQFSVEGGTTGLDWILMSPANIAEKQRVIQFAASRGFQWHEKEMNNWLYLRMDHGDLVTLCKSLIDNLFQAEQILLKYGGFKYKA